MRGKGLGGSGFSTLSERDEPAAGTPASAVAMPEPALRKAPRQDRGQRRIQAVLAAAEDLFASDGYEATTTNAIAARAQTSIGSLYQFFPNKGAIVQALADRYLAQIRRIQAQAFSVDALTMPLDAWIGRIVDLLGELEATNPGFKALYCDLPPSSDASMTMEALYQPLLDDFAALLARQAPEMDPARRALYVQVSCAILRSLLPLAVGPGRDAILKEIKAVLVGYLAPVLAPAPLPDRP